MSMSVEDSRQSLARLLQFTEEMLACTERGEWDALDALEKERNIELDACFAGAVEHENSPDISDAIAALIQLNDKLVGRVAEERERVLEQGHGLQQGRKASFDYLDMQSG